MTGRHTGRGKRVMSIVVEFDAAATLRNIQAVRSGIQIFQLSTKTGGTGTRVCTGSYNRRDYSLASASRKHSSRVRMAKSA